MMLLLLVLTLNAAVFPAADARPDGNSDFMFEMLHFTWNAAAFAAADSYMFCTNHTAHTPDQRWALKHADV